MKTLGMLLPGTWDTSWLGARWLSRWRSPAQPRCRPARATDQGWLLAAWSILAVLASLPPTTGGCPRACFCNTPSQIVYCSRRGLPAIPDGIPRDSLQLNLNGNVFRVSSLQRANFSHYLDLEHLYLSECGVESIQLDTFVDLSNLKWLDLSNNRIRIIEDSTFRGLSLMHLFLNGNRNIQIRPSSFLGLETTGMYLHDCSLQRITVEVLAPLNNTLRYLWLNGNEMERVDRKLLPVFGTLSHLRLGSNPLHCNCEIQWLKEFYDHNEAIFKGAVPPSCLSPIRLKGKFFNALSQFDFRCQAPVFNNIDALFDSEAGRLRCTATGDPAPTLFWIKPSGESAKYAPPVDDNVHQNEGVLAFSAAQSRRPQDLSGMYICLAYNEAGNVTLTLNVSWPRATKSTVVDVQHHPTVAPSSRPGAGEDRTSPSFTPSRKPKKTLPGQHETDGRNSRNHHRNNNNGKESTDASGVNLNTNDNSANQNNNQKTIKINNGSPDPTPKGKGYNFTALNMYDFNRRKGERLFNLTELVGAVIGTHVCTLLLCLIFMPIYLKRQWKRRHHNPHHHTLEKQPPNETLYLNGLGHVDFMDTPSPKR